jgi:hypothetical protein
MAGQRPDTRVCLKPTKGEGTITLASFWTDGDRPSGGLDRRIKRLKLELEDGTIVVVDNTQGAKSHFCNLYLDGPGQKKPERSERSLPQGGSRDDGGEWEPPF